MLERQLATREQTFSRVLERAVFGRPASPYRRLFEWAGIESADVVAMLARDGLEATLGTLHDAGVSVTLEEFKGRRPIVRPGLEIPARAEDFDHPLTASHYEASTGGSTSTPRRILVDLALLAHESAYHALFYQRAGVSDRPLGIWQPAPPGAVGIKTALMQAKLGRPTARWFSQQRLGTSLKHAWFTRATLLVARACGAAIAPPEFVPADQAGRVATWLAERRSAGWPAILVTPASAGVRVCRAALDGGRDIEGTLFVLGGEPFTPAKAALFEATRTRALGHYAMVEAGMIGLACQRGDALDDVHLAVDKIATIQRSVAIGQSGRRVDALFHTTLLPASPKLMINVESGDYGVLASRTCGCGVLPEGFDRHLHTIRSYEKLTSEGMNFLGGDLLTLVEQVLPARFGGRATDYQLLERERDGLPKVSLFVSPSVGEIDSAAVVRAVLDFLRSRGVGERLMTGLWSQGGTLEVVRAEPRVTSGGKILPLDTRADSPG